jgi:hypothetical protein
LTLPAGTTMTTDTSAVNEGRLGVNVTLPAGTVLSAGEQDLVTVSFALAAGQPASAARLGFSKDAGAITVKNASGETLITATAVEPTFSAGAIAAEPNLQTGLFEQIVSVSNPGSDAIAGVRLFIRNLTNDAAGNLILVYNATSQTNGVPVVDYGPLPAGASVDLTIEFYVSDRNTRPTPSYEIIAAPPCDIFLFNPTVLTVDPKRVVDGKFFAEFNSIAGRTYFVQYSSDMTNWVSSLPPVIGTGSRVQWIDNGPPRTRTKPESEPMRFYRVLLAQ